MPILMRPQVQSVSMASAYRKARRWGGAGSGGRRLPIRMLPNQELKAVRADIWNLQALTFHLGILATGFALGAVYRDLNDGFGFRVELKEVHG